MSNLTHRTAGDLCMYKGVDYHIVETDRRTNTCTLSRFIDGRIDRIPDISWWAVLITAHAVRGQSPYAKVLRGGEYGASVASDWVAPVDREPSAPAVAYRMRTPLDPHALARGV